MGCRPSFSWTTLLIALLHPVNCIQFFTSDTLPVNISIDCGNALIADVSCDAFARRFKAGEFYAPEVLSRTCTSDCNNALAAFQSNIQTSCADQTYNATSSHNLPISYLPDFFRYNYNRTCLKDNDRFCNNVAYQYACELDPAAPRFLGNESEYNQIDACDDCFADILQFDGSSPFFGGSSNTSAFEAFTSSCSKTGYTLSTSTFPFSGTSSSASPVPTCSGKTYEIQAGDDCHSISKSQGIGTAWLLTDNHLRAYCAGFPKNGTLCLQNSCKVYTVKANDTCDSIAAAQNVTWTQFVTWNPIVGPACQNINQTVGDQLCINKPGQAYVTPSASIAPVTTVSTAAPVPTDVADGTNQKCGNYYRVITGDYCNLICIKYSISLDDFLFLNPEVNTNCTNLFADESYCVQPVGAFSNYPGNSAYIAPTPTDALTPFSDFSTATFTPTPISAPSQVPFANGTRPDCYRYTNGDDLQFPNPDSVCFALMTVWHITADQLINWNPTLNASDPNCAPQPGLLYCSSAYDPAEVPSSDGPSDGGSDGDTPPIRDGSLTNCTEYYPAGQGTTCARILADANITIAQFYAWNPAVQSDCRGLWLGYNYCIKITNDTALNSEPSGDPSTVTATPSMPPSTASGTVWPTTSGSPPGPTQSGVASNCVQWYVAQDGDYCAKIENDFLITAQQFRDDWNPGVGDNCAGLWLDYAYCVGVSNNNPSRTTSTTPVPTTTQAAAPSPTQDNSIISNCNKYAMAQSGDWCAKFADDNGITLQNLYDWNAVLGSDGSGCSTKFWANTYYCTGVSS